MVAETTMRMGSLEPGIDQMDPFHLKRSPAGVTAVGCLVMILL
jgi:hypothetical protein